MRESVRIAVCTPQVKREKLWLTGFNLPCYNGLNLKKGNNMNMGDSEAKKKWDKENMVFVGFKLFRKLGDDPNDQDIIDFLSDKVKGEVIKLALREYINNHKENDT